MNDVLDEAEAAALLDCEPSTLQEGARRGDWPGVKVGRSWRFPRSALLEALHQKAMANMVKAPPAAPLAVQKKVLKRVPPALPGV